jgi:hypothetical protein
LVFFRYIVVPREFRAVFWYVIPIRVGIGRINRNGFNIGVCFFRDKFP